MAVKIRLKRIGMKKQPHYRVVVADSRFPRDGRFIEEIGYYNPKAESSALQLDLSKVEEWVKKGAQPTETVRSLIRKAKEQQ